MTPQRLDGVGQEWSAFLLALPCSQHENSSAHIEGTHSVYEMRFDLIHLYHTHSFFYLGETTRPQRRPSEHISEFMRASVKLSHGKSKMYDPMYMDGIVALRLSFTVLESGFQTVAAAEARETELATEYAGRVTQEFMISNQNRGRGKDTRPRFKRKKLSLELPLPPSD